MASITTRWGQHLSALRKGNHARKIQTAWNQSSPTDWTFQILEYDLPVNTRTDRETHWINTLKPQLNATISANTEKIQSVLSLRKSGLIMTTIASQINMSVGYVHKVIKNYSE